MAQGIIFGQIAAGGASIKSIQHGTVAVADNSLTGTDTITAVVAANSIVQFHGTSMGAGSGNVWPSNWQANVVITDSTTVTATRGQNNRALSVNYTVIEFEADAINKIQVGSVTLNSSASGTATITSVDTSKSILFDAGFVSNFSTSDEAYMFMRKIELTNSTTISASVRQVAGSLDAWHFSIVELN